MEKLMRVSLWVGLSLVLGTAHGLTGAQTAAQLNARFASTPVQCVGHAPSFACSGTLLGPAQETGRVPFWWADDEGGGTRRVVFLRKDHAGLPSGAGAGFVLFDRLTAVGLGLPYRAARSITSDTEVIVSDWNDKVPALLAIQGIYYDTRHPRGLLRAQRSQRDYHQATGKWLPLLRLQLDDSRGQVFGFSQQDQLEEGYRVVRRLNARYADTGAGSDVCRGNRANFNCRGVLLRTTDVKDFRAWDPSPGSIKGNGVSFSYFRADTEVLRTYKAQGFVVRELSAPALQPMTMRCVYPFDAHTGGADDLCLIRPTCRAAGVTSVQAWLWAYPTVKESITSCAFSIAPEEVELAHAARLLGQDPYGWNELIMAAWPSGVPARLPLEAFIHSSNSHTAGDGLLGGRRFQREYFDDTGRTLPLLQLHPLPAQGQLFSYRPEEQALD